MTVAALAESMDAVFDEKLKLLFVDDDPILREFAGVNLDTGGASVAVAADGAEALAAIRRDPPDILLLDLQMPRLDGFAVLGALRADPATARLPVIVITGRDDVASIDRAFSAGATSFLVKPINWRQLSYQIRYVSRAARNELALVDHIAEIERAQRELEATSAELGTALRGAAVASEAKTQFLATMTHELRTPLNAIIGFSEMLDSQTMGPVGNATYLEYAGAIRDSGVHLLSLVNDVLEYARSSAGKLVLCEEEFAPLPLVEEALATVMPQAKAGGIGVANEADFAGMLLRGDRRRVRQVLINLLSNAVKFTLPGGQVMVRARRDGGLVVAVSDTGIGIAEEDIPKALERFAQIDGTLARKYEGAGLGLPLAKQLIELHGGTLAIDSAVDIGTTVTITFPEDRIVTEAA